MKNEAGHQKKGGRVKNMTTEEFLRLLRAAVVNTAARPLRVDLIRFVSDGQEHCPITLAALYQTGCHFDPYDQVEQAAWLLGLDKETMEAIVAAADDLPSAESQHELRQALRDVWQEVSSAR